MRNYHDWIPEYIKLVSHTEAPRLFHFWAGVGAISGALRRRVWIDHGTFCYYPSMYIIFVAPPGVVSKSTTAGIAMDLLRKVPGVHFGPDSITWQSLVTAFAGAGEAFEFNSVWRPMSPLVFFSSELGLLVDFQDRAMINCLIDFWDSRDSFRKETKTSGNDVIEAPWITILACTTPSWIQDNMSANTLGGGFTSRCIFVFGEKKDKLVAFPKKHLPPDFEERKLKLTADLEHISTKLCGEFTFTPDAEAWVEEWYRKLWEEEAASATAEDLNTFLSRRFTHLNKLSMILSASRSDKLEINEEDVMLADTMITSTGKGLAKVFSAVGAPDSSRQMEKMVEFVRQNGKVLYTDLLRLVHHQFPDFRDFEGVLTGLIRAGLVEHHVEPGGKVVWIIWKGY